MMSKRIAGQVLASLLVVLAFGPWHARADFVLYDGALGTKPGAQGWLYLTNPLVGSLATETVGGGVTTLDTTARTSDQAGYFSNAHPLVGTLDRNAGFTVTFRVKLDTESHLTNDRAGFSVILLGSDSRGIELGFWQNEVWAQNDSPLFTHGEGVALNTTLALADYAVTILGNAYTLKVNGVQQLSGAVRNYTAFGAPYTSTNFLFFGDDTSSAAARTQIARVTLSPVPEPAGSVSLGLGVSVLLLAAAARRHGHSRRLVNAD